LTLEDAGLVGGASDANTTSLYTATLDGLGPVGDGGHAADEHVSISSIAPRAALLALLLLEPASAATGFGRQAMIAAHPRGRRRPERDKPNPRLQAAV
jgi:hypothetical protein